jgi:predicted permease
MLEDLRYRAQALLRRKQIEEELDEELRFHFEHEVEKYKRSGMSENEAKRRARLAFGGHEKVKEDCREARGTGFIELIIDDARYAVRQLRGNPTFALVMILTLALSIGANSAIFSVIDGVLLKRLPYDQPDRLVRIFLSSSAFPKFPLNPWDFLDFRARDRSFQSMAAFKRGDVQLSGEGEPIHVNGLGITSGYFRVLGLHPQIGREFDFQAEIPGNGLQVVISDRLWRTRLASDPNIVGRKITLNMQPFTVVGVMPAGTEHPGNSYHALAYGDSVDVWWPFSFAGDSSQRGSHYVEGIARLKPSVSVEQARTGMNALMAQLAREHPQGDAGWTVLVVPLQSEIVGATRQMLLVLFGAVIIVLLIACANAANLLLARASARSREFTIRVALGAPRSRVIRQLLTESLVISLAGGALGFALAFGGVRALVSLLPSDFPRAHDIHVSLPLLAFTLAVSLLTGVIFGLTPAIQVSRTDPKHGLNQNVRTATANRFQNHLRSALVVAEVSLACVLLISAGLTLRTFLNLLHLNPGFKEDHVVTASLSLPHAKYGNDEKIRRFYSQLAADLNQLPGVQSAGVGSDLPWTGYDENAGGFIIEGKSPPAGEGFHARYHMATPGYFSALGVPLLAGRFFNEADQPSAPQAIIINHAMAESYWPGENPVGKRVSFRSQPKTDKDWVTVVGVVGDVKDQPSSTEAKNAFWFPVRQTVWTSDMSVVVRAQSDPRLLIDGMRDVIHRLDPELAIADIKLMNQIADASISTPRFIFVLVALFAGLAILLAGIGAYGVIAYIVTQRTPEFGLHLALGAKRSTIVRMVLAQSARLAIPGIVVGEVLALSFGHILQSMLYGVHTADPIILIAVPFIVLITSVLASYAPSRRAAGADPMTALRVE